MDHSKKKPSLPRLTTNIPLLQKPPNASCNAIPNPLDASAPPIIMPERPARTSSMFKEEKHDEENIAPATRFASESMPIYLSQKSVDDSPLTKVKKLYYEDAFTARGSHSSPKDRVTHESVVVVELKTNTKVCDLLTSARWSLPANPLTRQRMIHPSYCRISPTSLPRSTSVRKHRC